MMSIDQNPTRIILRGLFILLLIHLFSGRTVWAQTLCGGTLGSSVVNIDFGKSPVGQNWSPALPTGVTTYTHWRPNSGMGDLSDGRYGLVSRLDWQMNFTPGKNSLGQYLNPSPWHPLYHDHTYFLTGEDRGNMFVVNADFNAGTFYTQQIDDLCSGMTYEFSAWALNFINGTSCGGSSAIKPNIRFEIRSTGGVLLGSFATGNLPQHNCSRTDYRLPTATPISCIPEEELWDQYGFLFTLPPGITSVQIRMVNQNPGGCGNDLAIDDITFRPCGPTINMMPTDDKQICPGDNFAFSAMLGPGFATPEFIWQKSTDNGVTWGDMPGFTSDQLDISNATFAETALYRVIVGPGGGSVYNPNCHVISPPVRLTIMPIPDIDANPGGPYCVGDPVVLKADPDSSRTYQWYQNGVPIAGSTNAEYSFTASILGTTSYHVIAGNDFGCTQTSAAIPIEVNAIPTPTITGDLTICPGTSTTLSIETYDQYEWRRDDGTILGTNQNIIINTSGNYILKVWQNGCTAELPFTTVISSGEPTAAFNLPASCIPLDDSVTFDASASSIVPPSTMVDYAWNFGDGATSNGPSPLSVHQYTAPGTYSVQLIVTGSGGCKDSLQQDYVFGHIPAPTIIGDLSPCFGSGNLQYSTQAYDQYEWRRDDGTLLGSNQNINLNTSGDYVLKVTQGGCTAEVSFSLAMSNKPTAAFSLPPSCNIPGSSVSFDASASTIASPSSLTDYAWDFGDGATSNGPSPLSVHQYMAPGTYSVQLIVTGSGGCKDSLQQDYVFGHIPAPTIIGDLSPCFGSGNLQYSTQAFDQYEWRRDDGTLLGSNQNINLSTSGDYVLKVTQGGCTAEVPFTVNINAEPIATFNLPPSCLAPGTTVSFNGTASSTPAPGTLIDYAWSFGDGTTESGPSAISPPHRYAALGTYTVALTVTNDAGCSNTFSTQYTLATTPSISFDLPDKICNEGPISLSASGQDVTNWNWELLQGGLPSGITLPNAPNVSIVFPFSPTIQTYTVKLEAGTTFGCVNMLQKSIEVVPSPKAELEASSYKVCINSPLITLIGRELNGIVGTEVYSGSGVTGNTFNPLAAGIGKHTLTYTFSANADCLGIASVEIEVTPLPQALITGSTGPFCPNELIEFKTPDGNSYTYQWSFEDQLGNPLNIGGPMDQPTVTFIPPISITNAEYTVKLTVRAPGDCFDQLDKIFSVHPSPGASLAPLTNVCSSDPSFPLSGGLPLDGSGGTGWYSGPGVNNGIFNPQAVKPGTIPITYHFKGINNCEATATQNILVYQGPQLSCNDVELLIGDDVELDAKITSNAGADYTYQWSPTTLLDNPKTLRPTVLQPQYDQTYTLTVTTPAGCQSTCTVQVDVFPNIKVPNVFSPNGDGINDRWVIQGLEEYPNAEVSVHNRKGVLLFSTKGYLETWDGTHGGRPVSQATYYWVIKPNKFHFKPITGPVTIIY